MLLGANKRYNNAMIQKQQKPSKLRLVLSIVAFSALDFCATTFFQDVLQAPLFFDTIFMMAALFAFGPVAAFVEYLLFNGLVCAKLCALYGKVDYLYLYSLSALTIIAVTWLFVRKKQNLQKDVNLVFLRLLTAAILAGFACSLVSGFISYFTYNMNAKDWAFDRVIFAFNGEGLGFLASAFLGRIPVTVLDRVITTFAGFGVFKLYAYICMAGGGDS